MSALPAAMPGLARVRCRGSILKLMQSEKLPEAIVVTGSSRIVCHSREWDDYWRPVHTFGDPAMVQQLGQLAEVRRQYFGSAFAPRFWREYCHAYFALLRSSLRSVSESGGDAAAHLCLRTALGFECFRIERAACPDMGGAATFSLRSPAYLLAKLKEPGALDSTQFLPLISPAGSGPAKLFYHYRRHKLSIDTDCSLLLYLATGIDSREDSFRAINSFERCISDGRDPRADERAKRITKNIIAPYVQSRGDSRASPDDPTVPLEIVDLGAGSGALASHVCRRAIRAIRHCGGVPLVRAWLVDLSFNPHKLCSANSELLEATDCITSESCGYRAWLASSFPPPMTPAPPTTIPTPAGVPAPKLAPVSSAARSDQSTPGNRCHGKIRCRFNSSRTATTGG